MQITDQQFIDAMHKSVAEKGPGHRAEATYTLCGEAECIIGYALGVIDKKLVPLNNIMLADALLLSLGASKKVATAAHVAQYLNDSGSKWGTILWGFTHALSTYVPGENVHEAIKRVNAKVVAREALEYAAGPKYHPTGGSIFGAELAALTQSIASYSACFTEAAQVFAPFHADQAVTIQKKDHALVA